MDLKLRNIKHSESLSEEEVRRRRRSDPDRADAGRSSKAMMKQTIQIKKIRGYPGTFHIEPRASKGYPWQLGYAGGFRTFGPISIHETKRRALAAFDKLKKEILADRREGRARRP